MNILVDKSVTPFDLGTDVGSISFSLHRLRQPITRSDDHIGDHLSDTETGLASTHQYLDIQPLPT